MTTVLLGENWVSPDLHIGGGKGYIIEYDNMGDFCASYSEEGVLRVPCVEVSDPSGGLHTYRIELLPLPFFPIWLFVLDPKSISPLSVGGTLCARYEADGLLRIPCVEALDQSGVPHAYQIELHQKAPSWLFDLDLNSIVPLVP